MVFLHDGDMVVLNDDGFRVMDLQGNPQERTIEHIEWDAEAAEKGGYDTYMLKEIYEQPQALTNTLIGRLHDETGEVNLDIDLDPGSFKRISIIACGTAFYAGLVGEYLIEQLARIPVEVDVASEYRYRDPSSARTPWPSSCPRAARPSTPWRRCARRRGSARRPSA